MPHELTENEEMAYPFLESAVRLDQALQDPSNDVNLCEALDNNVALWLLLKNHFMNTNLDVPQEMLTHVIQLSNFAIKAAISIQQSYDHRLLEHLINMNLNMSEIQLSAATR